MPPKAPKEGKGKNSFTYTAKPVILCDELGGNKGGDSKPKDGGKKGGGKGGKEGGKKGK